MKFTLSVLATALAFLGVIFALGSYSAATVNPAKVMADCDAYTSVGSNILLIDCGPLTVKVTAFVDKGQLRFFAQDASAGYLGQERKEITASENLESQDFSLLGSQLSAAPTSEGDLVGTIKTVIRLSLDGHKAVYVVHATKNGKDGGMLAVRQ